MNNNIDNINEKLLNSINKDTIKDTKNHITYMKKLISQGANINYRNKDGLVVLCEAAKYLHESELKFLINKGALVNIKDKDGNTP